MKLKTTIAALALCLGSMSAHAHMFEWAQTKEQVQVAGKIAAALVSVNICDFSIDLEHLTDTIQDRVAPKDGKFTPRMAAEMLFFTMSQQALEAQFSGLGNMNKKQIADYCKEKLAAFGPTGTSLPGILTN